MGMRTLIIVPTYNERDNVGPLIERIAQLPNRVDLLFVDDNSPDGTAKIVQEKQQQHNWIYLLQRPVKDGLGRAYRAGFHYAGKSGYDAVIQMDCDFSHDPHDLSRFVDALQMHDLVIGSRYIPGGSVKDWNWFRRTLSKTANRFARTVLGIPVHDLTGGFNGIRLAALETIKFDAMESSGYSLQMELKLRCALHGLNITEIPICFCDRQRGRSKIPPNQIFVSLAKVVRWRFRPPVKK